MKNIHCIILNIGLNDKDTHKQKHFIKWYIKKILKRLEYLQIEGCTITKTIGVYKGEKENSLKLEFFGVEIASTKMLARLLVNDLNQNEIIHTVEYADGQKEVEFIAHN